MKIVSFYIFLQPFYKYLAAEFFTGINSKLIQFTVFFPKEFEITGRKTFLVRDISKVDAVAYIDFFVDFLVKTLTDIFQTGSNK